MKKDLIFITDNYPFGQGETFIENEIEYLAENFKNIYIVSKNQNDIQTREVPKNCKIYRIKKDLKKLINLYLDKIYLVDLFKEFKLRNLKKLVSFQFYGKLIEIKVKEIIKENNLKAKEIVYYSYWFREGAYAGSILKRKNKIDKFISRAHGYDIFFERGMQPFKNIILRDLIKLYPACKNSENYLKKYYSKYSDKIEYSYLGTINNKKFIHISRNEEINIVSCSNLIKLKRVNLIIEALKKLKIKDKKIKWYHIGDGLERNTLEKLSKELKIDYEFIGAISNQEVLKFYGEKEIYFFIHMSSTEGGTPVSMMEAQSFGIPIIATNVGGVAEIVNDRIGILLAANPKIEEIAEAIEKMINLDENEYNEYRKNSYKNWQENFNAEKNYKNFISEILKV